MNKMIGLIVSGLLVLAFSSCAVISPDQSPEQSGSAQGSGKVVQQSYDATGYTLVWSDEFNGSSVDTTKWVFENGNGSWGWGNNEQEYYQPANATVTGGYLNITAKKESVGGFNYTSSRIKTQGLYSFQYGKIVARIKLPSGAGLWPAFWMLGTTGGTWPQNGEIDILENKGSDNVIYSTLHWYNQSTSANADYGLSTTTTTTSFHDYEVEWDSQYIRTRIDGVQFFVCDITPADLNEFRAPFFILLNLAVGGNFIGGVLPADSILPATMQVDYVRVYQKSGTSSSAASSATSSTASSSSSSSSAGSTFTYSASSTGSTTAQIWFKPTWTAAYVDVHYTLNGGGQLNYRMTYNSATARWEQSVTGLASGTVVAYYFTYEKSGLAYNTAWYSYTQGTAASSSTASSVASSSSSTGAISAPGVISSNVGAIANAATQTWTVNCTSAGNYRVNITAAGTAPNFSIALTFNGQTVNLSMAPGQVVPCDFAGVTAGNKTLSIKATTANVNIGKLEMVKY